MEQKNEFVISTELLKRPISEYGSYFRKIKKNEAWEKEISPKFNYQYSGKESLNFLGYKINNLSLVVKNSLIHRAYFEIHHLELKNNFLENMFKEYDYPSGGRGSLFDKESVKDKNGKVDLSKVPYDKFQSLSWSSKSYYLSIDNLYQDESFSKRKIWVNFIVSKED